eukprot:Skav221603  [mRNA]  locus=scaffold1698:665568:674136:+ [translate_table: standard]
MGGQTSSGSIQPLPHRASFRLCSKPSLAQFTMCLQTSPWAAQEAEVSLPRKCNTALVEEILANAAQASLEAPNRALKRRVRQRLHKKLGSMLTCEEFGSAMERFKDMEAKNEAGATSPTTHTVPVLTSTPPPQPVQQATWECCRFVRC